MELLRSIDFLRKCARLKVRVVWVGSRGVQGSILLLLPGQSWEGGGADDRMNVTGGDEQTCPALLYRSYSPSS